MSLRSNFKTDTIIKFAGQIGNDKVFFWVDHLITSDHFKLTAKLELARAMPDAKLENVYDASKENHVNQIKEKKQNKISRTYIELTPFMLIFLFLYC